MRVKVHLVFGLPLTGLGDRSHLISKNIRLETHITDIVNFIKLEGLQNFTAVAHSYGGWPISGVAERAGVAIGSIVFPDAFMPAHEDKELDLNSPQRCEAVLAAI